MVLRVIRAIALSLIVVLSVGCGSSRVQMDDNYMKSAEETSAKMKSIFDKADGKWSGLAATDKKEFTDLLGGDEAKAKFYWARLKNPQKYVGLPYVPGSTNVPDSELE